MEVWKDIKGYEGYYQVSNLGNIKGLNREIDHSNGGIKKWSNKPIKLNNHSCGYKIVSLCLNGTAKTKLVHRLVANAFLPNPDKKAQVNHKDLDKTNNSVENLEWSTPKENIAHYIDAFQNNLPIKRKPYKAANFGENHGRAKITEIQAIDIKYNSKNIKPKELSKIYGIGLMAISNIRNGKTWTHI